MYLVKLTIYFTNNITIASLSRDKKLDKYVYN